MTGDPLISVILPVFNAGAFFLKALASVRLQQWSHLELIVVDSSTDGSSAAVQAAVPEAKYLFQEGRGPGAARNAGLALATGEWVAFLDSDDEWQEGGLAALAAALAAQPAALFAIGKTRFDPPTVAPWVSPNLGAALYRRVAFDRIGLLAEKKNQFEDVDWFLRVREQGLPYATVDKETLCYRRRAGSLTAGMTWRDFKLEALIRASLARRRQADGGQAKELNLLSGSANDPRAAGSVNQPPRPEGEKGGS